LHEDGVYKEFIVKADFAINLGSFGISKKSEQVFK
jgi:hypothetical protein